MEKTNKIKLGVFFAMVIVFMGSLISIAPAKTVLAVYDAPSDSQESTIKQILTETGAEFGWDVGDCFDGTPAYEGAEAPRHCYKIIGPRAMLERSDEGSYVPRMDAAHYWLEVPTRSGGGVWIEGPLRIMAYSTEKMAKDKITESIKLSSSLAGFDATTFHDNPAVVSSISTLGGKTIEWQSDRFYFMAGNSIATETSHEKLAEALYANAIKHGLITENGGETVLPVQDSDGDGITDDMDQCPGTPAGTIVDTNGCPIIEEMTLTISTDKNIYSPEETVIIKGSVRSTENGLDGIAVALEISKEEYSATSSVITNSSGEYTIEFPIPSDVTEATYTVSATTSHPDYPSVSKSTSFVVGESFMQIEKNTATEKPFIGVVADGTSSLDISISLPECSKDEACSDIKITKPDLGKLEGTAIDITGKITLNPAGTAKITYRPPDYINKDQLTDSVKVHQSNSKAWFAEVPLTLTYTDINEKGKKVESKILIYRPPVMLVHGFLGAEATWGKLSTHLQGEKFDTYMGNYGATNQSIEGLSLTLKQDIQKQKNDYINSNIKLTKVDIVGHSMGGLISRYYSNGLPSYIDDVRKIIMVGTPNHGVSWSKKITGNIGAGWYQTHSIPAEQLYSESQFIRTLNGGEKSGAHLDLNIQYGNIYGFPDDWVVNSASAYLNGVKSVSVSDVKHSPDIPGVPAVAITEYLTTWEQVKTWLTSDIYRPPLKNSHVEIFQYWGNVYLNENKLESFPVKFDSWQSLRTEKDSKAIVHLKIDDIVVGVIFLDPESEIFIGYYSPQLIEVRLWEGSATFRSKEDSHFTVPVNIKKSENGEWWSYSPKAIITGRSTEFAVTAGENTEVHCLEGELVVETPNSTEEGTVLSANNSISIDGETITTIPPVSEDDFWWSTEYTENWYNNLTRIVQSLKTNMPALTTFVIAVVLFLFFIFFAILKFCKKKIGAGVSMVILGLVSFCIFGGLTWFLTLDKVKADSDTNTAIESPASNIITPEKSSTITVADYRFTIEVGKDHADKIRPISIDSGSFAKSSYIFCYDTKEENDEVIFCNQGEAPVFSIDIMTQAQWEKTANSSYEEMYLAMAEREGLYYIFSHPGDILPSDVPASQEFYNTVMDSIEFYK